MQTLPNHFAYHFIPQIRKMHYHICVCYQKRDIYSSLINSFEEYRYLQKEIVKAVVLIGVYIH